MPAADTQRRAVLLALAGTVVLVAVAGLALSGLVRRAGERVGGHVRADGTSAGSFAFAVNDCASGHAFVPGFFGADLRGDGGFDLRVEGSGDDARLSLFPRGATRGALPIGKGDCPRWDVQVASAGVTVNRVRTVSGHVHVTCRAGGGALTADADFTRCGP